MDVSEVTGDPQLVTELPYHHHYHHHQFSRISRENPKHIYVGVAVSDREHIKGMADNKPFFADGLVELFEQTCLGAYLERARQLLDEWGAVEVSEVTHDTTLFTEFQEKLQLKKLEQRRLVNAIASSRVKQCADSAEVTQLQHSAEVTQLQHLERFATDPLGVPPGSMNTEAGGVRNTSVAVGEGLPKMSGGVPVEEEEGEEQGKEQEGPAMAGNLLNRTKMPEWDMYAEEKKKKITWNQMTDPMFGMPLDGFLGVPPLWPLFPPGLDLPGVYGDFERWVTQPGVQCGWEEPPPWAGCVRQPQSVPKTIECTSSKSGGARVLWTVRADKLQSKDTHAHMSPPFQLTVGEESVPFKMMMQPKRYEDTQVKNRASFRAGRGRGFVELRLACDKTPADTELKISFRIGIGSRKDVQTYRGFVTHDFAHRAIGRLPTNEAVWNFKSAIDHKAGTFIISLEVVPQQPPAAHLSRPVEGRVGPVLEAVEL